LAVAAYIGQGDTVIEGNQDTIINGLFYFSAVVLFATMPNDNSSTTTAMSTNETTIKQPIEFCKLQ
jgi:hypothetical protein